MKKIIFIITLLTFVFACGSNDTTNNEQSNETKNNDNANYSSLDFENIGFEKTGEFYFQLFGGIDGWQGKYDNQEVAVIFFDQEENLQTYLKGEENTDRTDTTLKVVCRLRNAII